MIRVDVSPRAVVFARSFTVDIAATDWEGDPAGMTLDPNEAWSLYESLGKTFKQLEANARRCEGKRRKTKRRGRS